MGSMKKILALGVLAMAFALPAFALDVNDIKVMVQNDVQDSVIINMVQNRGLSSGLSTQDIIDLSNLGASSTLLSYLSSTSSPGVTYVEPAAPTVVAPSTTYVVPQPEVIVTPPPPVYYYNYGYPYRHYRPGPSFSFWFGSGPRRGWGGPPPPPWGWGGGRPHPPRWGGHGPGGHGPRPPRRH